MISLSSDPKERAFKISVLRRLDITMFKMWMLMTKNQAPSHDLVALAAMHKIRIHMPFDFSSKERQESKRWLAMNQFTEEV